MSAMGADLRRLRRLTPEASAAPPALMAMGRSSSRHMGSGDALVDLARQDGGEFVGEALEPRLRLRRFLLVDVVGDDRRNGCREADRRREQGFGNARATTASEVFFEAAIEVKEVMMPQTVPKRPMKGPAEPTVASTSRFDS